MLKQYVTLIRKHAPKTTGKSYILPYIMAGKIQEHLMKLDEVVPEETKPRVKELVGHVLVRMKDTQVASMRSRPDYKFIPPFNSDVVEWEWEGWAPRRGDVLIVSFPKTG